MKDYEQIISTLLAKISELKRRLNKDSSNSSKPPSSDGLKKASRTSSLREKGNHTSGGQKGNHRQEVLRFLHDAKVTFTNNDTERDLRMVK